MISAAFDLELFRFGTCGTLITCYGIADHLARRRDSARGAVPRRPRGLSLFYFASVLAFYLLIGPTGGALLHGWGNLAGIAVALLAAWARLRQPGGAPDSTRAEARPGSSLARGLAGLLGGRAAEISSRLVFYAALPAAVGVPWGWLVLTVPAWAASFYYAKRIAAAPVPASPGGKRS